MPLSAQNHGVSFGTLGLTNRMPVGKKKSISGPSGNITAIDTIILVEIGPISDSIVASRWDPRYLSHQLQQNLMPLCAPAPLHG